METMQVLVKHNLLSTLRDLLSKNQSSLHEWVKHESLFVQKNEGMEDSWYKYLSLSITRI